MIVFAKNSRKNRFVDSLNLITIPEKNKFYSTFLCIFNKILSTKLTHYVRYDSSILRIQLKTILDRDHHLYNRVVSQCAT